ncbi:hypothetical protein VE00_02222 [Pseudogymnoascus sp. WSF 3629]|nr:hypothetical protein VE00_02222 [Pseudogymnoascus sp. WSF 3629]
MVAASSLLFGFAALSCLPNVLAQGNPGQCPGDDGQYRTTSTGMFLITCSKRNGRAWMNPKEDIRQDFPACIDACSARSGCFAVDYNVETKSCGYINQLMDPVLPGTTGLGIHNARRMDRRVEPVAPPPPSSQVPISDGSAGAGSGSGSGTGAETGSNPDSSSGPGSGSGPGSTEPSYSQSATCGNDNGKIFMTEDGSTYKVQCSYSAAGRVAIGGVSTQEQTFAACIEKCSKNSLCSSVQYHTRSATPGECVLLKEGTDSTTPNAEYDVAIQVDPPFIEGDDYPNQLCTTTCPFADGVTYTSSHGESFKMDCGKRHGTRYFTVSSAENLQECMETCAAIVPCQSVDYQARTRKCYLGSHHNNPLVIASSFDSAHSVGCAGACGGGGCCKDARKDDVQEPAPLPDTSCDNAGFEFAMFPNDIVYSGSNDANFNPVVMKRTQPYYKGTTTRTGITDSHLIYGQTPQNWEFVAVNHRGYLYAHQDGEYSFTAPIADNLILLWLGPNAYSGYTRANANLEAAYTPVGSVPLGYKATLVKGKYYPIRFSWDNSGGAGNYELKIKAPDGTTIVDGTTTASPYLVKFGCREAYGARQYALWGEEN